MFRLFVGGLEVTVVLNCYSCSFCCFCSVDTCQTACCQSELKRNLLTFVNVKMRSVCELKWWLGRHERDNSINTACRQQL